MNNSIQDEIINLCSVSNNKFKQDEIIIDNIYKRLKIIMIECYSWRENMPLNKIVNLKLKISNNINLIKLNQSSVGGFEDTLLSSIIPDGQFSARDQKNCAAWSNLAP